MSADSEVKKTFNEFASFAIDFAASVANQLNKTKLASVLKLTGFSAEAIQAAVSKNPEAAFAALLIGAGAAAILAPEVAAVAASAAVAFEVAEAGVIIAALAEATATFFIKRFVDYGIHELVGLAKSEPLTFASKGFSIPADSPELRPGKNLVSVNRDPANGSLAGTIANIPSGSPGQVDVNVLSQVYLTFKSGTFSQLSGPGPAVNSDFTKLVNQFFSASLQSGPGKSTGTLEVIDPDMSVKIVGTDGTVINLPDTGTPRVSMPTYKSGTLISAGAMDGSQRQLVINTDSNGNFTIDSNIEKLTVDFDQKVDTLLHSGAESTLDIGPQSFGELFPVNAFQVRVTNDNLILGRTDAATISLKDTGFVKNSSRGQQIDSAGATSKMSLVIANGNKQNVTAGSGSDILIAGGNQDTLTASQAGQTLVALGQSGDTLAGHSGNAGLDKLIAEAGNPTGSRDLGGNDTLIAGAGTNIMVADGVNATFNINNLANTATVEVIWAKEGTDTLNINGVTSGVNILEINDPSATLATVANLDPQALSKKLQQLTGFSTHAVSFFPHYPTPLETPAPTVVVIGAENIGSLTINGKQITAADVDTISGSYVGLPGETSTENFLNIPGGFILGFTDGDFGIKGVPPHFNANLAGSNADRSKLQGFVGNGTPQVNLQDFQQGGSGASSGGGGGSDPSVIDEAAVFVPNTSDTLVSINAATAFTFLDTLIGANGDDTLTAFGQVDTLIAVTGVNTLVARGFEDTLFGDAAGSTLIGQGAFHPVAAYALDNVTVVLYGGSATVNGSDVSDDLDVPIAEAFGANDTLSDYVGVTFENPGAFSPGNLTLIAAGHDDTLIGEASQTTLFANGQGNILVNDPVYGNAVAEYAVSGVTVDLATGTASVNGSSTSDTLVGFTTVITAGANDTIIAGSGADTLSADGTNDVLIGNGQNDTLLSSSSFNFFSGNTLIGGSGTDTLLSTGNGDSLIAGSGADLLSGFASTLFGNAAGSTLINGEAVYGLDNVTVNLAAGTAGVNGAAVADTLVGITTAVVLGSNDTIIGDDGFDNLVAAGDDDTLIAGSGFAVLSASGTADTLIAGSGTDTLSTTGTAGMLLGGNGSSTLIGDGGGNTLVAGPGQTVVDYTTSNVTVDLATGTASVNGSSTSDTLVGITVAEVFSQDTLIGGSGNETLYSNDTENTIIAGSGADTLFANFQDTLIGTTSADVLISSNGNNPFFGPIVTDNVLIAGSGADTLASPGMNDTLIGDGDGATLLSSFMDNTLFAGAGPDTLISTGTDDTLFGGAAGSTLDGSAGIGTVAAYSIDDVTVDLATGSAGVNGASASDTLIGITMAAAFGSGDTLIGGSGSTTLISDADGNTLIAGSGPTTAAYAVGNVTVDLATQTALLAGAAASDTLVGIAAATVSGTSDTVLAGSGSDTLSSSGANNTLIGGSGADTLSSSGTGDTLLAGSGANFLSSSGIGNTLVAGSTADTLVSTGPGDIVFGNGGDILFGNAAGSTLDGSAANGAVAAYALDNVTVNLASGTANLNGGSTADTLIGFTTVAALGSADTLIDGSGSSTLLSNAAGNTLIGGSGQTTAAYTLDNVTVDLEAGLAFVNSSTTVDTLSRINSIFVSGSNDTAIGGAGGDVLNATGVNDVLIAGSGADTLQAYGFDDTLFGNARGSTLQPLFSAPVGLLSTGPVIAAYTLDNLTIDGTNDTARVNGSSANDFVFVNIVEGFGTNDTLIGGFSFSTLAALGANDTLIGGSSTEEFISDAAGNTLIAGQSAPVAIYSADNLAVDLVAGTARVNGAAAGDTLIGINAVTVSGTDNTIVARGSGDTLTGNASTVLRYATDNLSVDLSSGTAGVNGTNASDELIGIVQVAVSGNDDSVRGGFGFNTLSASGNDDTLIGGDGPNALTVTGSNDTAIGNLGGSVLTAASTATGAVVSYVYDDVTVDMGTGHATGAGSIATDSFTGFSAASVAGSFDTLVGGSGAETLSSTGSNNTVIAGSGVDTLSSSGTDDVLVGRSAGDILSSSGQNNALVAGDGIETLISTGTGDMLVGNAAGSTLIAAGGSGAIATYTLDNATIDLAAGTASVSGSGASDTLVGFDAAMVLGDNDTLIGGPGATLIAAGSNDTVIGGSGIETLTASGTGNTLVAGNGADILSSSGESNTLLAGGGLDTLSSSGTDDTLLGRVAGDVLTSSGEGNSLVAGGGVETLSSSGAADTLFGNAAGSTLDGSAGTGAIAVYSLDNVAVDLVTGTASLSGSGVSDTLVGIATISAIGSNDTLIGGTGPSTLLSSANGNTLIAGTGATTAAFSLGNLTVNLATGIAGVNGASASDTLLGITDVTVSGFGDTVIGGAGVDTLSSTGGFNTLIAGSGVDALISSGTGDTLFGNAAGSTLDGTAATGAVGAYAIDDVTVDLATGTAAVNGSSVSDTLLGITTAAAFGTNDTLIGGSGGTILIGNAGGNTLIAGVGQTTADYALDNVALDLATGTASVNGASTSDTLVGISSARVSGSGDTLVGGSGADTLASNGFMNSLVAGSGIDTLASTGFDDTLFGNALGSTLDGSAGTGAVAAYSINNVTVDLSAGTAAVNGSSVSDTLLGISDAAALGSGDTLIGGSALSTLISNAAGNTLAAGTGETTVAYGLDHVAVDLAAGTATVNGSGLSDTLIGIDEATVAGSNDTVIGNGGTDLLTADGFSDTLIANGVADALVSNANGNTLIGTNGLGTVAVYSLDDLTVDLSAGTATVSGASVADTLIGIAAAAGMGVGDTLLGGTGSTALYSDALGNTLIAGTGATTAVYDIDDVTVDLGSGTAVLDGATTGDTLVGFTIAAVGGTNDTVIAGSGADTLIAAGFDDTLFGNAGGSTLDGSGGSGVLAAYSLNNVTVDLATGTAGVNGSGASDTLVGIEAAGAFGTGDTLIGSAGATTLISDLDGNTLIAGTGPTTAAYSADNATINLATGTAGVNGSGVGDTLIGITAAAASGSEDTVIGGSGSDVLSSSGTDNTLIAGSGSDTLSSSGTGDTLIGNAAGSTLDGTAGSGTVADYALDNISVDLATGTAEVNGSSVTDTLVGILAAIVSGSHDTLIGDAGVDTLASTGSNDTLIVGSGVDTLIAAGTNDTLFGNGAGSTLDATAGIVAVAAYAANDVIVDLATESAAVSGSTTFDTLLGLNNAVAFGTRDLLIGNGNEDVLSAAGQGDVLFAESGLDTLVSNANGNTLDGAGGIGVVADYASNDLTVDFIAGTARVNGSSAADTLIAIDAADVSGSNDTFISDGSGNTLIAGSTSVLAAYTGSDLTVELAVGMASVNGAVSHDKLVGITVAAVSGSNDTIKAGAGADTLIARGSNDILFGNASGSTLDGTGGLGTVAAYARGGVTVDLASGTAAVNGSGVSDTLLGIETVVAFGANDTLIAGAGTSVLIANAAGETLIDSGGLSTLISGSGGDTLVESAGGTTLISNADGNTLIATSAQTTAAYARANVIVDLAAGTAQVSGASVSNSDTLVGVSTVTVSGRSDTVIGGSGTDTLIASGSSDSLIAGTGGDLLISRGLSNTLFGNFAGSTLDGTNGIAAVAAYAEDNATVDLSAGIAAVNGTSTNDSLLGIFDVTVSGNGDTIVAGNGNDLLSLFGQNGTLIGGSGADTLSVNETADTLIGGSGPNVLTSSGYNNLLVAGGGDNLLATSGTGDTLFGGPGADTLYSSGSNSTLIAGDGSNTLASSGSDNTLLGGSGSDLLSTIGEDDILIAGSGSDTLSSSSNGPQITQNTLIAGSGMDTLTSDNGRMDTLIGGSGADLLVANGFQDLAIAGSGANTLTTDGFAVLQGGTGSDTLLASGFGSTLIAGTGVDTLVATGTFDLLQGSADGSTLDATGGINARAEYSLDNVTIDLLTGTASINGSSVADTLLGISSVNVSGNNDTVIGGSGTESLTSFGDNDTLIAGSGDDSLISFGENETLIAGSGADFLDAEGTNDELVAGSGVDVLEADNSGNTLVGGSGTASLFLEVNGNTVIAGTGPTTAIFEFGTGNGLSVDLAAGTASVNGMSDTLIGITSVTVFGFGDTVIGGSGADTLSAAGFAETLIGGAGTSTLLSDTEDNLLIAGSGPSIAAYTFDDVDVDLAAGTANGPFGSDSLVGITAALVFGSNDIVLGDSSTDTLIAAGTADTLIAGSGTDTLFSNANGNTLDGSAGIGTVAAYAADEVTVDLAADSATVNGAAVNDTLIEINTVIVSGSSDTVIAGSGADTLAAGGTNDTLVGNAAGSTLEGSAGIGTTAVYALDNVTVDLATGTAGVNGSGVADTLVGINAGIVAGNNDTLIGDNFGDVLSATGTNDTVLGGTGNDTLVINDGTDTFFGGGGNDIFAVLSATITPGLNQPQNLIGDFDPSNPDETIDLTHIAGVSSFADLGFSTVSFGGQSYLLIALGNTGQAITLAGVTADELSASNFVFAAASSSNPPTLSNVPATASFTEQGAAVTLASALSVNDAGITMLAGATVSITGGTFAGDGDLLAADTSGTSITASYSAATEMLTLSGSDSLSDYQQVLESVTFSSTSNNPTDYGSEATRTLTWLVDNGQASNNTATATEAVSITAVNNPPTLSNVAAVDQYTEAGGAITLAAAASVSDPDSLTLVGATVAIAGGTFANDGDVLAANTAGTGITASYNAATETLILSGSDMVANYQQVLDSVTFGDAGNLNPTDYSSAPIRAIVWTLNDGGGSNNLSTPQTTTVVITAVNNPPTLSNVAASSAFTEGGAPATLSPSVTVSDPDNLTLAGATVQIVGGTFANDGDVLSASTAGTVITASYNAATETLVLSGSDTLADYRQVLDSVTFGPTSQNPTDYGSNPTRTVTWVLNDGSASNNLSAPQTETVSITAVNNPPTLSTVSASSAFTEGGAAATLSSSVTVSDPDNLTLAGATVSITGGTFANDGGVLAADTAGTGITASYNAATETLALSGSDTLADYRQVLDSVTFRSTSQNPTDYGSNPTRIITWVLNDGSASNNLSALQTETISITAVNNPPTLSNVAATSAFTEGGAAATLSPSVTVSDPDNLTLAGATVQIVGGTFANDGDLLAATTAGTVITASYNSATETLTVSGSDTLADYQQVLDSVTFSSTSQDPTNAGLDANRTVTWVLNDGSTTNNLSAAQTEAIGITAYDPTLSNVAASVQFTEGHAALKLSSTVAVTDPERATLASATVAIAAGAFAGDGDVLAVNTTGTSITASYNSSTETLVLSGSDTLAHYQKALRTVTFVTASDNPDDYGSNPTRTVTWLLNDGGTFNNLSATQTETVSITAINDPPTLGNVVTSSAFTESGSAVTLSPSVAVSDPDNLTLAGATVSITTGKFSGDGDLLSANTAGTAITASYDTTSETLTLSGSDTLAHYQQVLDSVTFTTTSQNPDDYGSKLTRAVTWVLNDGSASSNKSTTQTETVNITAINNPPTLSNVAASAQYTPGHAAVKLSNAVTVTDPDNLTFTAATVAITAGTFAGDGDVLAAVTTNTVITASYDSTAETLTLTGSDTLAHYQKVLRSVTFSSTSADPTNAGADPTRVVDWVLDDGSASNNLSTPAVTTIAIPPTLTLGKNAVTVAAGGSIALPITVSPSGSPVTVSITGLASYETLTDNNDATAFSGNSITLTAAEVNSGLTLHSSYTGTGHPVNTLTVTANDTANGQTASSAPQTITVTDPPPATPSSDTTSIASNDIAWTDPTSSNLSGAATHISTPDATPSPFDASDAGSVLWTSHDPTVSNTGIAGSSPPSQSTNVGAGVAWTGASNSPSLGQIASGLGTMLPLIGPVGFDSAFSAVGAGAALWQGMDSASATQGGLSANGAAALHGSSPDVASVPGTASLLASWTTNNQHLMIGMG